MKVEIDYGEYWLEANGAVNSWMISIKDKRYATEAYLKLPTKPTKRQVRNLVKIYKQQFNYENFSIKSTLGS